MNVSGRPLFWVILALILFLFWKAPGPMSAVLGGIASGFASVGNGVAAFLSSLTGEPL
ncbi:hypothetical protein [Dactylosporangium cerinum]|uniref:hypothetical protein n=1 Tax=Dactylosporangium cerinum TaxID=1434730 RepID=UPI0036D2B5EA